MCNEQFVEGQRLAENLFADVFNMSHLQKENLFLPPNIKILFWGNSHLRQVALGLVCLFHNQIKTLACQDDPQSSRPLKVNSTLNYGCRIEFINNSTIYAISNMIHTLIPPLNISSAAKWLEFDYKDLDIIYFNEGNQQTLLATIIFDGIREAYGSIFNVKKSSGEETSAFFVNKLGYNKEDVDLFLYLNRSDVVLATDMNIFIRQVVNAGFDGMFLISPILFSQNKNIAHRVKIDGSDICPRIIVMDWESMMYSDFYCRSRDCRFHAHLHTCTQGYPKLAALDMLHVINNFYNRNRQSFHSHHDVKSKCPPELLPKLNNHNHSHNHTKKEASDHYGTFLHSRRTIHRSFNLTTAYCKQPITPKLPLGSSQGNCGFGNPGDICHPLCNDAKHSKCILTSKCTVGEWSNIIGTCSDAC